jgi:hypothetical protein
MRKPAVDEGSGRAPARATRKSASHIAATLRPTVGQRRYLGGLKQPGGKLSLFDHQGREAPREIIKSCVARGWALPWVKNPIKPDWLICRLTAAGYRALGAETPPKADAGVGSPWGGKKIMHIQEDRPHALAGGAIVDVRLEILVENNILTGLEVRAMLLEGHQRHGSPWPRHGRLRVERHDRGPSCATAFRTTVPRRNEAALRAAPSNCRWNCTTCEVQLIPCMRKS